MTSDEVERARRELATVNRETAARLFAEALRRGDRELALAADQRLQDIDGNGSAMRFLQRMAFCDKG